MKKILCIVFALFGLMTSCSSCTGQATAEYNQYFDDFNTDLISLGYKPLNFSGLLVVKKALPMPIRARCKGRGWRLNGDMAVIEIDERRFVNELPYIQKMTIYHEIGHCFMNLEHSNKKTKWIMTAFDVANNFGPTDVTDDNLRQSYVLDMIIDAGYPKFY